MININKNEKYIPQNLLCPPASCTDNGIAVVWDEPELADEIAGYQVYINGHRYHEFALREEHKRELIDTIHTDYTMQNLAVGLEYSIEVCAVLKSGEVSLCCESLKVRTLPKKGKVDITDFGAVGDGVTLNTKDIQRAIDTCPEGGIIFVPSGVFLTGALFLKSNVTLYLDKGAILLGSDKINDYPLMTYRFEGKEQLCYASLINTKDSVRGERLSNIGIEGYGVINASGEALFKVEMKEAAGVRGRAICIRNTDNVYLRGITVRQSPAWCVHLICCNNVSINNVRVYTKYDENGKIYKDIFNGDGIDPDSCSNVYIFNSLIASQDDCIAIKSGRDEEGRAIGVPCQNIRITNCTFESGFGVAIGSEMSGGIRNVLVKDCKFTDTFSVGTVKAPRGRGNIIENINYENISYKNRDTEHKDCRWFRGAIYVDQFYGHEKFDINSQEEVNEGTPVIQNLTFKNIEIETIGGNAIYLAGLPESPLKNISLLNISAIGRKGMKAYNVSGLAMENVTVKSNEDEDYIFEKVSFGK